MCHSNCSGGGCCGGGHGGCTVSHVAKVLLIVGGVNWGLIGFGLVVSSAESWNVISMILGSMPVLEGLVYLLVGVAAVVKIFGCRCKKCKGMCKPENMGNMGSMENKA